MNNAPKKIWVWDYAADQMVNENPDSTDVAYIRADLVDELVKAVNTANDLFTVQKTLNAHMQTVVAALKEEE